MLDNAIPQGFEDAVELRRKNRETVVKYMNTKGQDRLRRHENSNLRADSIAFFAGIRSRAIRLTN